MSVCSVMVSFGRCSKKRPILCQSPEKKGGTCLDDGGTARGQTARVHKIILVYENSLVQISIHTKQTVESHKFVVDLRIGFLKNG